MMQGEARSRPVTSYSGVSRDKQGYEARSKQTTDSSTVLHNALEDKGSCGSCQHDYYGGKERDVSS